MGALSSSQFGPVNPAGLKFQRVEAHGPGSRRHDIIASDVLNTRRGEQAVGTVSYYPPSEAPTFRIGTPGRRSGDDEVGGPQLLHNRQPDTEDGMAAYPKDEIGEQGRLFVPTPAKVDGLAVHEERRGMGLGVDLARAAVDEHQRRFGQGTLPTASKTLSPDSAGLVTKITGSRAKVEWGDHGEATGRREQDRWARTQVEGADEHLRNPNREKFPAQPTDALDRATARPGGPPPAPSAPYQRGWTPGQEKLF